MSKIYHNIKESKYIFETDALIFKFSSKFYLDKFKGYYKTNREEMLYKLSSRFLIVFESNDYFDTILYSTIEKRGFSVFNKSEGVEYECLKNLKCVGRIQTMKD